MKNINKWCKEYFENIDISKIQWVKYSADELYDFLLENYLDKKTWKYVLNKNHIGSLLGMNYLGVESTSNNRKCCFLIGIVNNNINKKTIVADTIYFDNYILFENQEIPVTYISTMEVNSYFRNRGIYKQMCNNLSRFINQNQPIIITRQSEMGEKCHVFEILKDTLESNGFDKKIFVDNYERVNLELYNIVCSKQKVLKK